MTRFESIAGQTYMRMDTTMSRATFNTLGSIGDIERNGIVDTVSRVVGAYALHAAELDKGNLVVCSDGDNLEVFEPESFDSGEAPDLQSIRVNITQQAHHYLHDIHDEEDEHDLLEFWDSAVDFYGRWSEKQLLGHHIYSLSPRLQGYELALRSELLDPAEQPAWRRFFNQLLRG